MLSENLGPRRWHCSGMNEADLVGGPGKVAIHLKMGLQTMRIYGFYRATGILQSPQNPPVGIAAILKSPKHKISLICKTLAL